MHLGDSESESQQHQKRQRSAMKTPELVDCSSPSTIRTSAHKSASACDALLSNVSTTTTALSPNINEESSAPPSYSPPQNLQSSQPSQQSSNPPTVHHQMMDPPILSVSSEICIMMQSALARESILLDTGTLTLRTLKDIACNFIDRNFPDHRLGHLTERLLLFRHYYADQPVLLPINTVSDLANDSVVEVILSAADKNSPTEKPRPHSVQSHSYKTPTYCDHCGMMLMGLFNQGLKCEGCGLNFHKRCVALTPNNCTHSARRRRSSTNLINLGIGASGSSGFGSSYGSDADSFPNLNSMCQDMKLLSTSPAHHASKSGSSSPVASSNGQTTRFRVAHTFNHSKISFGLAACVHCKKTLMFLPGIQCKVCKLIVHSDCKDFIHSNCIGENGKNDATSTHSAHSTNSNNSADFKTSNGGPVESKSCYDFKTDSSQSASFVPSTSAVSASSNASNCIVNNGNHERSSTLSAVTHNEPDQKQPVEYQQLNKLSNASSNNIKLMRIVQSVKHVKRRNSKTIKEGRVIHYSSRDATKMNYYWRLDAKTITMFKNDNTNRYQREIALADVQQILLAPAKPGNDSGTMTTPHQQQPYVFEIRTDKVTYFCGDAATTQAAREWEFVIRQTLKQQDSTSQRSNAQSSATGHGTTVNSTQNRPSEAAIVNPSQSSSNNSHKPSQNENSDEMDTEYQIFVGELLGAGQFGQVFGGVHKSTDEQVAIKVIDKLRFPQKQEEQLKNEVSILRDIRHPGVVTLKHMYEHSNTIFVVMEKLSGDMLEMILNSEQAKLPERVTKFIIYQILIALKYLHSQNICHCDLKPENVLLSSNCDFPQVKLCDFGFARIIGEKSFRRSVVGTPAYLAPEVLKNKGYNKSLDMWSVGVIIYVSLSGTFPFHEEEDIQDQIQNAGFMYPHDAWKDISRKAIALISNLLQVQCNKRLSVDKSLNDPWLNDYVVWCDLRRLEKRIGVRWLTHESDEVRWDNYRIKENLPIPDFGPIVTVINEYDDNNEEARDRFSFGSSFQRPYRSTVTQDNGSDNSRL